MCVCVCVCDLHPHLKNQIHNFINVDLKDNSGKHMCTGKRLGSLYSFVGYLGQPGNVSYSNGPCKQHADICNDTGSSNSPVNMCFSDMYLGGASVRYLISTNTIYVLNKCFCLSQGQNRQQLVSKCPHFHGCH